MSEFGPKVNGVWAPEDSPASDSDSPRVQLPSVRALASRFNALAQSGEVVVRGTARPPAPKPAKKVSTPAPVVSMKTPASTSKVVENKVQKSSAKPTYAAPPETKPPTPPAKDRMSVTTDTDDEVFDTKVNATEAQAPAHFVKKQSKDDTKQKSGFSTLPSRSPAKKWNSLSDLHTESSPKKRSDSLSSTTIFGVSLRRLDAISWGVTQARKSTVDDSDSSSDDESQASHPELHKTDSGSKSNMYQKHRPAESVSDNKRAGSGVKGKINQKMGNKEDVKYHSFSDLTDAGVEASMSWPRRIAIGEPPSTPHQPLTRRQSISDLLKLYRSKSQTDLRQGSESKPPPSPKFETFARPKTPVSAPLTMYDLKISNPMEKAKVSPYKSSTKDIVRLPPGSVTITPKKPILVLGPVPSKNSPPKTSVTDTPKATPVSPKETTILPQKTSPPKPASLKTSETTNSAAAKKVSVAKEASLSLSSESAPAVKTPLKKTVSASSSSSDSASEPSPPPQNFIPQRKAVYQPPPKHFNRPFINHTTNVTRPKATLAQKPKPTPKTKSIESLSRMYTPVSYRGSTGSTTSENSTTKPDQRKSSTSSEEERSPDSSLQKKVEVKSPDKGDSPVSTMIQSLNAQKSKPAYPAKPDVLKPKPQDPVWTQKANVVASAAQQNVNASPKVVSNSTTDHVKQGRKISRNSSQSSDEADSVPHDEKSGSFIGHSTVPPLNKKVASLKFPATPPNSPTDHPGPKKYQKLSVTDTLKSWAQEVSKDSSSGESSDENDRAPEETTGSYDFTSRGSRTSSLPTTASKDATGEVSSNVVLIKHNSLGDNKTLASSSKKKENFSPAKNSSTTKQILKDESLPVTVSVRKAVKAVERRPSSSSDDGIQKQPSKISTPLQHSQQQLSVQPKNNVDWSPKKIETVSPKKNQNNLNARPNDNSNRRTASNASSSSETSGGEPFKEIDPYAIGRMIVRGSRKSDSVVKKPENLTGIQNASVPSHSPFSPIKSPTRKMEGVVISAAPKVQKNNASDTEQKKPVVRTENSSSDEQRSYKITKTKRGNFVRRSLSASSDFDSDGEKGGLELSVDSDRGEGIYSANVAFIE